jgi:hypothetical protein
VEESWAGLVALAATVTEMKDTIKSLTAENGGLRQRAVNGTPIAYDILYATLFLDGEAGNNKIPIIYSGALIPSPRQSFPSG